MLRRWSSGAAAGLAAEARPGQFLLDRRTVDGRRHVCRLDAQPLASAADWLRFYERFWSDRLDALEDLLTRVEKQKEKGEADDSVSRREVAANDTARQTRFTELGSTAMDGLWKVRRIARRGRRAGRRTPELDDGLPQVDSGGEVVLHINWSSAVGARFEAPLLVCPFSGAGVCPGLSHRQL